MKTTRLTPTERVIDTSLLPASPLGGATPARPELKSDVFTVAKTPSAPELTPAEGAAAGKKVAAELRKIMEGEVATLANKYRLRYGPAPVKKADFGWDVDKEEAKAKQAIATVTSDASQSQETMFSACQRVLVGFANAMNDYHVSLRLLRTSAARLPFQIRPIGDGYAISVIDRAKLSKSDFPFEPGDEVIAVDGKPVSEVVADNLKLLPRSNAIADRATAARMLTVLRGATGAPMPNAPTRTFTIKRADGSTHTHDLAWTITAERIKTQPVGSGILNIRGAEPTREVPSLDMTAYGVIDEEALAAAATAAPADVDPFLGGGRKTLLPDLGPVIFRTDTKNPFDAYVYRTPEGKNVGVIRLPEFSPADANKLDKYVDAFAELIEKFEATTDALVIDQQNNPGGYFYYMMALLSMLSPQPLKMPKQNEKITPAEVAEADELLQDLAKVTDDKSAKKALGKAIAGLPVTYDLVEKMRAHSRHILKQAELGKDFTDAFPLGGIGVVNPSSRATYSKPILCLVNATCYSCGDFFPSALQQNKRAVIMGETTAGAGGYVIREKYLNKAGIDYITITGSVADLADKDPSRVEDPLEGRGVKPEIPYSPTLRDLREHGADMAEAVNRTIKGMIEAAEKKA